MNQRTQKESAYSHKPIEVSSLATPPVDPEEAAPQSETTEGEAPLEVTETTEAAEVSDPFEPTEEAVPYEATEGEAPLGAAETAEVSDPLTEPLEGAEATVPNESTEGETPLEAAETTEVADPLTEPLEATEVTELAEPVEAPEAVPPTETAETASWSEPAQSPLASTAPLSRVDEPSASERFAAFLQFLDRTKRAWVIAASAILALLVVGFAAKRVSEWTKVPPAVQHSVVATNITPEVLTTRCGQPAADVTTEMYPLLTRTMTYEASGNQTYIFSFSRTAEKNSDWLFLSMKDVSGTNSYDTPEAEVAAMPCLNSPK